MYQYTHSAVVGPSPFSDLVVVRPTGSRLESQFAEQHRSKPC